MHARAELRRLEAGARGEGIQAGAAWAAMYSVEVDADARGVGGGGGVRAVREQLGQPAAAAPPVRELAAREVRGRARRRGGAGEARVRREVFAQERREAVRLAAVADAGQEQHTLYPRSTTSMASAT